MALVFLSRPSSLDKRLLTAAIDDVGDDSGGVGTPSSSRRLSRRQRKNNRKREKEEKVSSSMLVQLVRFPKLKGNAHGRYEDQLDHYC